MPLILKALQLHNNQTVIDLGAGDGVVIFEAAAEAYKKKLNTKFYADEINPVLLGILWIRRLFHPNKHNIHLIARDMFVMKYADIIGTSDPTFYLYISPWFIEKTVKNIQNQILKFSVVSYFYRVDCLSDKKVVQTEGVHGIFRYS